MLITKRATTVKKNIFFLIIFNALSNTKNCLRPDSVLSTQIVQNSEHFMVCI